MSKYGFIDAGPWAQPVAPTRKIIKMLRNRGVNCIM